MLGSLCGGPPSDCCCRRTALGPGLPLSAAAAGHLWNRRSVAEVHAAGQPLQAVKKALKAPRGRLLCYKILHRLLADLALVPAGGSCRLEGPLLSGLTVCGGSQLSSHQGRAVPGWIDHGNKPQPVHALNQALQGGRRRGAGAVGSAACRGRQRGSGIWVNVPSAQLRSCSMTCGRHIEPAFMPGIQLELACLNSERQGSVQP